MFSQRGVVSLGHSLQEIRDIARRVNANRLNGIDSELLTADEVKKLVPILDTSPAARYPVLGASLERRGGTARHDALAWGYARAADARGIDIIQHCEVTGLRRDNGGVVGVETSKGFIKAPKVAVAVAGNSSVLANMAGIRLPIESHPLQAWVSEPVKLVLDVVVMSNAVHALSARPPEASCWPARGLTRTLATARGAASRLSKAPWRPSSSCSLSSAACASGAASSTSAPMPAR